MNVRRALGMAVALAALTPAALLAAEEGEPGLFSINLGLSIWTTVLFLLLLFVLWKFAWGPILQGLEAREHGIQSDLDQAAHEREEAARLLAEHKQQLAESRQEAQKILADARAAAEEVRKDLEARARSDAEALVESARKEITRERDAALSSIREESVELALAAASRLIAERLDAQRDRQLVESFLTDVARSGEGAQA